MRASLPHSRTMLHQSSGGAAGNIQDARIQFDEWEKVNKTLFDNSKTKEKASIYRTLEAFLDCV
jgi:ATP-dependent protease ClpP protease subunit